MRAIIFLAICLVAGFPAAQSVRAAEGAADQTPILQVRVNVPPAWRPWLEDDVAEALTDRVRELFVQRGWSGRVERIDALDDPTPGVPLLTLDLFEWRINRIGNIDCTFTASLQAVNGLRQFGLYTNTSMRWLSGPGRFGLARSFEDAAEGALRQLCDDVARSEMLPGLHPR